MSISIEKNKSEKIMSEKMSLFLNLGWTIIFISADYFSQTNQTN